MVVSERASWLWRGIRRRGQDEVRGGEGGGLMQDRIFTQSHIKLNSISATIFSHNPSPASPPQTPILGTPFHLSVADQTHHSIFPLFWEYLLVEYCAISPNNCNENVHEIRSLLTLVCRRLSLSRLSLIRNHPIDKASPA